MQDVANIRDRVEAVLPGVLDDLVHLVSIPSISSAAEHAGDVARAGDAIVGYLKLLGCPDVRVVQAGGAPAVIGHFPVAEDAPTVCLYAHFDVQPTGDPAAWTSPPFEASIRGDRLYGRGTADDKAGIAAHLAVLRAFDGRPPVNVTVLFEGEEELGSPTLARILAEHREELAADLYVIADCGNWRAGSPAFTTSLRGVVDCRVEVRTLDHGVHSGQFGGAVPDALTTLCRLLATLHDERGEVAVAGLVSADESELVQPEETLRAESGLLAGVQPIGTGSLVSRTWTKPAISVIGLDATPIAQSSNTLIPAARARVSLRVAPGDTTQNAWARLKEHLETHIEWGAELVVQNTERAEPCRVGASSQVMSAASRAWREAFGVDPVLVGTGGTIGMIAEFQQAFPAAGVLCTAVADPDCRMHGIDESLYLPDWRASCLAEALLLADLAGQPAR